MSARNRLSPKATFVQRGYGQVEPNHLSGPREGRVYAQLPADPSIDILENGQFVKYDYAHGVVTTGKATIGVATPGAKEDSYGEWMLVLNEIKIYRDFETDADFAMKKDNYVGRVYSPGGTGSSQVVIDFKGEVSYYNTRESASINTEAGGFTTLMPEGTTMMPRVIGTNVGDIWTTNTIKLKAAAGGSSYEPLKQGDILDIDEDGYLKVSDAASAADFESGMLYFQVVKVYTMPDNQPGVKIQRIA